MVQLKPGDRVVCCLKLGKIVSPYVGFDEEKEFEIIARDFTGYFLYVPEYYGLYDTVLIQANNLKSLKIDKKFLNSLMIYTNESNIFKIKEIMDGMTCISCSEFYKYATANTDDNKLQCWYCRHYKSYN